MVTVRCGGSPAVLGQSLGGAGQPADLQQGVSVALRRGSLVGDGVGSGSGCGELVDQRPERGTVLGFQVSLQPEPPVAAVPQPQLPRSRGRLRLVAGLGTVGIEVGQDVLADPVQRRGVKRPGMASQLSLRGVAVGGADAWRGSHSSSR